jgi:hypothetical protein
MYAIICTRPDSAHVVSVVSRFMHNPGKEHWNAVKWNLRYLKGTSHFGLLFDKNSVKEIGVMGLLRDLLILTLVVILIRDAPYLAMYFIMRF